jgi:hypothetical protein
MQESKNPNPSPYQSKIYDIKELRIKRLKNIIGPKTDKPNAHFECV